MAQRAPRRKPVPVPPWRRRKPLRRALLALAGLVAVTTALPLGWLAVREPPTTAFMLWSRRADPATGHACPRVHQRWVPRTAIARDLRHAVVLAEDQRFLEHHGFDLRQLRRAVADAAADKGLRGASTLSQQLAKNLFLWPGRSFLRKGLEAWFTVWLEAVLSKQRILELYLNVAQFGPCTFGAEAAARLSFGVSAAQLDARQAALLAAVLPSPGKIRADDPGPYAQERTEQIVALLEKTRGYAFLQGL
jgi:monofunctional biosynthetic peptidoglycan transglycosylase